MSDYVKGLDPLPGGEVPTRAEAKAAQDRRPTRAEAKTARNDTMSVYAPSDVARAASDYFNSLPEEERIKLAPLLENYRQMGLAEAAGHMDLAIARTVSRVRNIQKATPVVVEQTGTES